MHYYFRYQPYRRLFQTPLHTHHGLWQVREGLWVGLQSAAGTTGWGEVAPLPWFGSETLEQAIAYCQSLPAELTESAVFAVPDSLPACQFGLGSAWAALHPHPEPPSQRPLTFSALLPAGQAALETWLPLWQAGCRTFKWKIGVAPLETELALLAQLTAALPATATLRLDANGGLSLPQAQQWLQQCDHTTGRTSSVTVEYLEQPLPASELPAMRRLSNTYQTPIALDESVATLAQLTAVLKAGWAGIVVVKPAIAGYPQVLQALLETHRPDVVFSSVFETTVGRQAVLALAQAMPLKHRALGFGTAHWFPPDADDYPADVA